MSQITKAREASTDSCKKGSVTEVETDPSSYPQYECLHIMTWNVAGARHKLQDVNWLTSIQLCDVVLLQETWLTDNFIVNGFKTISTNAIPSKAGRAIKGADVRIGVIFTPLKE